jgi:phage repressor protein C with HTH and peptisase S24 domain
VLTPFSSRLSSAREDSWAIHLRCLRTDSGRRSERLEDAKEIWLSRAWLIRYEFRARPANLRVITIDGDPMEPLLHSGDRVLVDTSQCLPVPPGIFVIWNGMGILAKRVEDIPHSGPTKLVIKSVNSKSRTYRRQAEEAQISGPIIQSGRRL